MILNNEFNYAYGCPTTRATLRQQPTDFQVDEISPITASGEGEHVLLHIRKVGENTDWVAKQLARFCQVKPMAVSYAGLKDRHAVTTQFFSVQLSKQPEPDWTAFNTDTVTILSHNRHNRKLRRGALQGNRFVIVLRSVQGEQAALEQRLIQIAAHGVPNYFGEQRFGHGDNNLTRAAEMLLHGKTERDRHKRSLYLSAARSWLFNLILSQRVADENWQQAFNGEVLQLAGSHSVFVCEQVTDEIRARLAQFDVHPTAPLWGKGASLVQAEAAAYEAMVLQAYQAWCDGLVQAELSMERRALRLRPVDLQWQWLEADRLQLQFNLPAGAYATTVLREVVDYSGMTEVKF